MQSKSEVIYHSISLLAIVAILLLIYRTLSKRDPTSPWYRDPSYLSKLLGLFVGLCIRVSIEIANFFPTASFAKNFSFMLSFGFLFVTPFCIGLVTTYFHRFNNEEQEALTFLRSIFVPWVPVSLSFGIISLLGLEGSICLVMASPLWLSISSLGGVSGWLIARSTQENPQKVLCSAIALPFIFMLVEAPLNPNEEVIRVDNYIDIQAPISSVWHEIKSVRAIEKEEHSPSLFTSMGFPRPLEAKLEGSGVGAVRYASFEGGVVFTEKIYAWEKDRLISFSITANTDEIPKTTLDEHVTIGGAHFDMLSGTYEIESLSDEVVRLHLWSEHRMRTSFNWYAQIWSKAIMSSIQRNILEVIRKRCEKSEYSAMATAPVLHF
jgi:hypothetical protein